MRHKRRQIQDGGNAKRGGHCRLTERVALKEQVRPGDIFAWVSKKQGIRKYYLRIRLCTRSKLGRWRRKKETACTRMRVGLGRAAHRLHNEVAEGRRKTTSKSRTERDTWKNISAPDSLTVAHTKNRSSKIPFQIFFRAAGKQCHTCEPHASNRHQSRGTENIVQTLLKGPRSSEGR